MPVKICGQDSCVFVTEKIENLGGHQLEECVAVHRYSLVKLNCSSKAAFICQGKCDKIVKRTLCIQITRIHYSLILSAKDQMHVSVLQKIYSLNSTFTSWWLLSDCLYEELPFYPEVPYPIRQKPLLLVQAPKMLCLKKC